MALLSPCREGDDRPPMLAQFAATFDLARDPMLRAAALLGEEEHLVLLVMHHVASDGWSTGARDKASAALFSVPFSHSARISTWSVMEVRP